MSEVPPDRPQPQWTIGDFFIVIGGWLAASVLASALILTGMDVVTLTFLVALPAQSLGLAFGMWIVLRRRRARLEDLGFEVEPGDARYLVLGLLLALAIPLLLIPVLAASGDETSGQALIEAVAAIRSNTGLLIVAGLGIVIVGPVMEELTFRGLLMKYMLQRSSPAMAIFVTSAVWGLVHAVGVEPGASLVQVAVNILAPFLLGLPLGLMTIRSGRLGYAIFMHAGYNLLQMILLVIPPEMLEQAATGG